MTETNSRRLSIIDREVQPQSWGNVCKGFAMFAVAGGFVMGKYLATVRPFASIGEWSLQIHLIHIFVINLLSMLLGMILPVLGMLGFAIILALATTATYLSMLLFRRTTKARSLYAPPLGRWPRNRVGSIAGGT